MQQKSLLHCIPNFMLPVYSVLGKAFHYFTPQHTHPPPSLCWSEALELIWSGRGGCRAALKYRWRRTPSTCIISNTQKAASSFLSTTGFISTLSGQSMTQWYSSLDYSLVFCSLHFPRYQWIRYLVFNSDIFQWVMVNRPWISRKVFNGIFQDNLVLHRLTSYGHFCWTERGKALKKHNKQKNQTETAQCVCVWISSNCMNFCLLQSSQSQGWK